MKIDESIAKAQFYLQTLCNVKPNRRTGSAGNREATNFFADKIRSFGYAVDAAPFECLDHICDGADLTCEQEYFEVWASPYSLGCDVRAKLVTVSTLDELESASCEGQILLMKGDLCSEQLMPKNFVFYNPEHHQKIIALLESRRPAGIVTATERKPDQVGALYPFPLFVDGDFDIPSVFCKDTVGEALANRQGEVFRLTIKARRIPSSAANVIGSLHRESGEKIVVTAHIDAYENTPGASDNASGTVVLLLLAEMLSDDRGSHRIEIAAFNGEDHYSVGGQMDYLKRYGSELGRIKLVMNVDDVGYIQGRTSFSFYECASPLEQKVGQTFSSFGGLVRGDPWFNGDHMIFVQNRVPALAFTSDCMPELMRTVTHTSADTPDIIDCGKLVEIARSLNDLVRSL